MNGRHARQSGARRRALGLAVVGTAAGVLGVVSAGSASDQRDKSAEKYDICHRTSSVTNPYRLISVPWTAIDRAHSNHTAETKQSGKKKWSDVIPEIEEHQFPGVGLEGTGKALLANQCFPLGIAKEATESVILGEKITYKVTVTNLSAVAFPSANIDVVDPSVDAWDKPVSPPELLDPGKSLVWMGYRTPSAGATRLCGTSLPNTATASILSGSYVKSRGNPVRSRNERKPKKADKTPSSRSATASTTILCPLEVAIAKTSTQTSVEPGGTVNYTVRVTNPGPIPLPTSFLTVTDPTATSLTKPAEMPPELKQNEFLDWAATKAVAADLALCGTNVQNTASVTVTPPPKPAPSSVKKQNGVTTWPNYTSWPKDPVSASAQAVLVSGGICPVTPLTPAGVTALRPAAAALTVAKTGPARALAGGRVTYRVTVTNTGSSEATGVVLRDQPPSAMALVSKPTGSRMQGTAVLWDIGTIPAGQSVSKSIRFTTRRTAEGRKCNTAFVVATGVETAQARACTVLVAARRPVTPVTG